MVSKVNKNSINDINNTTTITNNKSNNNSSSSDSSSSNSSSSNNSIELVFDKSNASVNVIHYIAIYLWLG
jgi:hypothetical protein